MRTEKKAITDAIKSSEEWMASEMTATDPVNTPTISLSVTTKKLLIMDKLAALVAFKSIIPLFIRFVNDLLLISYPMKFGWVYRNSVGGYPINRINYKLLNAANKSGRSYRSGIIRLLDRIVKIYE